MTDRPSVVELLRRDGALLTRGDLRELGLERRAIDAVFRALPVVALPGYSRPLVRVEDYLALVERCMYADDRSGPERASAEAELVTASTSQRPPGSHTRRVTAFQSGGRDG